MHEVSIATALVEQVRRHIPAGRKLIGIKIEAGPFQSIDPEAMDMAWVSVIDATELEGAKLFLTTLPYQMTCPKCARKWESADAFEKCTCGSQEAVPSGSSELRLVSMEVEDEANVEAGRY